MNKHNIFDLYFDNFGSEKADPKHTYRYTEEDIQNAQTYGHAQGYAQGIEEGFVQGELKSNSEHQQHVFLAYQEISTQLNHIVSATQKQDTQLIDYVIDLSRSIIRKLLPALSLENGLLQVEQTVREVMSTMVEPAEIIIEVHPSTFHDVQERLMDLKVQHKDLLIFQENNDLKPSDCHLVWKGGGARLSQGNIQEQIEHIFKKYKSPTSTETPLDVSETLEPITETENEPGENQ